MKWLFKLDPFELWTSRRKAREYAARFPGSRISARSVVPAGDIRIGRGTYGRLHIQLFHPEDSVEIGNFCSIGPEVLILAGGEHRTDLPSTYPFRKKVRPQEINTDVVSKGKVSIGHDVWIGARSLILSGVTLGNGVIVAGGSVVTRGAEPYSIVGGNPAKVIRRRFGEDVIEALQRIAWWEWPDEIIRERMNDFYVPVAEFVLKYDPAKSLAT